MSASRRSRCDGGGEWTGSSPPQVEVLCIYNWGKLKGFFFETDDGLLRAGASPLRRIVGRLEGALFSATPAVGWLARALREACLSGHP